MARATSARRVHLAEGMLRERVGDIVGWTWAPLIAAVAKARHTRFFHADGHLNRAEVVARSDAPLAKALAGEALVRFSTALWRGGKEWPDVLGCAVRFHETQDLLFATTRTPWTLGLAPLLTRVHDYLANRYYAVSPFDTPEGRRYFRLTPPKLVPGRGSREERLEEAIAQMRCVLTLEAATPLGTYAPLADIHVRERLHRDQEALRFSPFHAGEGIRPRGLIHALRHGTYLASQFARPTHAR